jgi:hypothetical protein
VTIVDFNLTSSFALADRVAVEISMFRPNKLVEVITLVTLQLGEKGGVLQ